MDGWVDGCVCGWVGEGMGGWRHEWMGRWLITYSWVLGGLVRVLVKVPRDLVAP